MTNVPEIFGTLVFNDAVMKERLPEETYNTLKRTMAQGKHLDAGIANIVANAMKDWAVEKGATHFTHWFQPLTGVTAEKHDSFIASDKQGGVIMEFSGKELIKGESDASSFPSGGLRATFEARGYTAWDPTSYAFIKDQTLCIPTAFCSYGGEALDAKTPLLRSMEAINKQALRVLRLFGHEDVSMVTTTVGSEQEYFLIPREMCDKRLDLQLTGRTLFGAKPPKGQELDDHYFGVIKPRVAAFMRAVDEELWKLGVLAKTEHNEAAPAQHELAPIFSTTNIAADHNQIIMETLKKVAQQYELVCLLHEKPFAGVNGSGKHNNWSLCTNTGMNLLEPGETPYENAQFLIFLCAVLRAVDEHQDLLRISVASAGNDHRLGAAEAPPAVVSIFLGEELTAILEALESEQQYNGKEQVLMKIGVHTLPRFPKDNTDRNRTSPLAFTGNRFEFRMPGAALSIADPNVAMNTAVAESLDLFATELESAADFNEAVHDIIVRTIRQHKRIIFNGNGYDASWIKEAEERGLLNLPSTPACLPYLISEKNLSMFEKYRVFSPVELHSRYEIQLENYCKILCIEAKTMVEMARKEILPAVIAYQKELSGSILAKKAVLKRGFSDMEEDLLVKLSTLSNNCYAQLGALETALEEAKTIADVQKRADYYHDVVFATMQSIRADADKLETLTASNVWPYPTYADLLFGVK